LAVVVAHDKTGGLFLNGPRRRETAGGHDLLGIRQFALDKKESEQITADKRLFAEAFERAFCCGKTQCSKRPIFFKRKSRSVETPPRGLVTKMIENFG
jgi:hypothetical protein